MLARSLAMLALMLPAAGPAFAADAEPVTLVTAVAYGTHVPGLGEPASGLTKLLKERSGGAVALDLKQPGDGTKPDEILDKVSSGAIDAGFAPPGLWAAKLPAAPLFSGFPFGPDAKLYLDWFERGDGRKLDQEMYDHAGLEVHVMPCAYGGAETGGWFKKEIATKADIGEVKADIADLRAELAALRIEMKAEFAAVRNERQADVGGLKAELFRFMYVQAMGVVGLTVGLTVALIKLLPLAAPAAPVTNGSPR